MWNLCNSCSNVWRNSGCGCRCGSYQRVCRDCNGNIWVRVANSCGCSQSYTCGYAQTNSCPCSSASSNANSANNAGFGCCARQNGCTATATADGYSYSCNGYYNN